MSYASLASKPDSRVRASRACDFTSAVAYDLVPCLFKATGRGFSATGRGCRDKSLLPAGMRRARRLEAGCRVSLLPAGMRHRQGAAVGDRPVDPPQVTIHRASQRRSGAIPLIACVCTQRARVIERAHTGTGALLDINCAR